jgi:hypothetical protein
MKTKSTVRPSEIQSTVLNLERTELGAGSVEVAMIFLLDAAGGIWCTGGVQRVWYG